MSEIAGARKKLKESVVKQASKTLAWAPFEQHLSTVDLDRPGATEIIGHLRRSSEFLLKRHDPKREALRATFVDALAKYLADQVGAEAVDALNDVVTMIQQIEAGYAEILRTLQATVAAKLLPEVQASAALYRAAFTYHDLTATFESAVRERKELTLQSFRLTRDDGSTYSPDGVLAGINDVTTMTLLLLGHQHRWFDADEYLVLPNLTEPTDDEVYKAGLTEALAASWSRWERMEQRCRYFEGSLKIHKKGSLPDGAPVEAETLVEYEHVCEAEYADHIANQRLNDRFVQTFQEMLLQTNVQAKVSGIGGALDLPPGGLVSPLEGHACVSLSEILGYAIVDDREAPCGLRLIEWIRGYAVLQALARERYDEIGRIGLYFNTGRAELIATLERLGLVGGSAERFIDLASLRASSRDLFDQPLIRMQDGSLLVFGPGILNADPARLTLSAIGNRGQQLSRKGKAFEREMLEFLRKRGLDAHTLKFRQDGKEYEYDVLLSWGDHIFIFECKNRTLSGHNPVAAYYFALEMAAAEGQVRRLADGLVRHADIVRQRTGIDVTDKVIVPCVLNSLPYAINCDDGEVYFTDASGLRRFFQERYFHLVRPHRLRRYATVLHRTAMKSLWSGERPTPSDLRAYLGEPLQLQLAMAHTARSRHAFGLGERTVVAVTDLAYAEMTIASISKLFSIDPQWIKREVSTVKTSIAKARLQAERRASIKADRAWRCDPRRKR